MPWVPVRPVKGQLAHLRPASAIVTRPVYGDDIYLVPKAIITRNPLLAKEAARDISATIGARLIVMQLAKMNGAAVVDVAAREENTGGEARRIAGGKIVQAADGMSRLRQAVC